MCENIPINMNVPVSNGDVFLIPTQALTTL